MVAFNFTAVIITIVLFISKCAIAAPRPYYFRSDLQNYRPIQDSGWTLPLQLGSRRLPAPSAGKALKVLSVGRGTMTYDCTRKSGTDIPLYHSQNVKLYDISPIWEKIPSQDNFNQLIRYFLDYNYARLNNSTIICNGQIYTLNEQTTIDLENYGTFEVNLHVVLSPPPSPSAAGDWTQSVSPGGSWEVYRVWTAGDVEQKVCAAENGLYDIQFAAEYWFYEG